MYIIKKLNFILTFLIFISSSTILALATEITLENNSNPIEKSIYLTFDDGLSNHVTSQVVDILNSENIKGTFFLIGETLKSNPNTLNKIIDSDHSIGLHTYSHERNKIYKSKEAFVNEMNKCNDILFEMTGTKSYIIRFPFGSNNDSFKLNKNWEKYIHDNGYKIFDWTVDTSDGSYPNKSPYKIYKSSISTDSNIILLMHTTDLNKNSVLALKDIIKHYKDEGYTFKKITFETEEIYKLKNEKTKKVFSFLYQFIQQ
ncbi:MAG: polysaccharide deacetylase family protein [Sarcina sp.]